MPSITISLAEATAQKLADLAAADRRRPRDQAAIILERAIDAAHDRALRKRPAAAE